MTTAELYDVAVAAKNDGSTSQVVVQIFDASGVLVKEVPIAQAIYVNGDQSLYPGEQVTAESKLVIKVTQ